MLQNIKVSIFPAHNGFRSFYHAIVYILHKKRVKDRAAISKKNSIFGGIFE